MDSKTAPILSSSPVDCVEQYVSSVMSEQEEQIFRRQSHHTGENVPCQYCLSSCGSNDLSPQPTK
jgi:hypothetical protein